MPKIVDAEARRSELIDAVAGQITKAGMEGVTMREVARAAGWTTGAVSHYFADKRELVLATFHSRADLVRGRIEMAVDAGVSPLDALVDSSLVLDAEHLADWQVFIAFWGAAIGDPELTTVHQERNRTFRVMVEDALRTEVESGRMRADLDLGYESRRLVALLNGLAIQVAFDPGAWSATQQRRVVDEHLASLATAPRTARTTATTTNRRRTHR